MLTPEQLDKLPDKVVALYEALETQFSTELAHNMRARLILKKTLNELLIKQNANVRKAILYNRRKVKKALNEMLTLALNLNLKNDIQATKSPLLTAATAASKGITNIALRAGVQNLLADLIQVENKLPAVCETTLRRTLFEVEQRMQLQVLSSRATYEEAIKAGIAILSEKGITLKKQNGVSEALDVVVRRSVLTGINAAAGAASMQNAMNLGFEYVEVSAHIGARNKGVGYVNHESWQGKVYHISDQREALRLSQLARPVGYQVR